VSSAAGGGSKCPAANLNLNATSYVSSTAGNGGPAHMVFELRAPSETNGLQYKQVNYDLSLDVYYQFTPN
jgi:hypothetical protein